MGEVPKGGKLCYIHQADFGPFVWPVEEMREPDLAALTDFLVFYMFFVCFFCCFEESWCSPLLQKKRPRAYYGMSILLVWKNCNKCLSRPLSGQFGFLTERRLKKYSAQNLLLRIIKRIICLSNNIHLFVIVERPSEFLQSCPAADKGTCNRKKAASAAWNHSAWVSVELVAKNWREQPRPGEIHTVP